MSSIDSATKIGRLYCVIGPSGVGKDTLVNRIIAADPKRVAKVIGHTTRERRATEVAGVDMHFISTPEFKSMLEADQFTEHAVVHGNMYGMTAEALSTRDGDKIAIVTVDALEECCPIVTVLLTVEDPMNTLRDRLEQRGDSEETIMVRMTTAREELLMYEEKMDSFEYIIPSDDRDDAFHRMRHIMGYD